MLVYIRHPNIGSSPGVIVWGVIGYTFQSSLVRIDITVDSGRYIFVVLRPVALPFIRAQRNATFQQDNARSYVADIIQTFLDTEDVRLLPWSAHSLGLSSIENVRSVVTE